VPAPSREGFQMASSHPCPTSLQGIAETGPCFPLGRGGGSVVVVAGGSVVVDDVDDVDGIDVVVVAGCVTGGALEAAGPAAWLPHPAATPARSTPVAKAQQ
jgi:hypothetical protein